MKITQSRNQREGRFIAGWCYNPWLNANWRLGNVIRAGGNNNVRIVNKFGKTYVLVRKEQA